MKLFFVIDLPTKDSPSATLTCNDFDATFIIPGVKPTEQPIQQFYARMPQSLIGKKATMNTLEFAGTSGELNAKKGSIFDRKGLEGTGLSSRAHGFIMRSTKDKIQAFREIGTAFNFMNDPAITKLFNRAQDGLKGYLDEVDERIAASNVNLTD